MQAIRTTAALLGFTAALALATPAAQAAQPWYAGINAGTSDWHSRVAGVDGDGHKGAARLYGGYRFNRSFALETGALYLGEMRQGAATVESRGGAYFDAIGFLPIAQNWSLLGRAGASYSRFRASDGRSDSGPGVRAGIGVQYDISPTIAVRGEYEYNHVRRLFTNGDDRANVGMASVGFVVGF